MIKVKFPFKYNAGTIYERKDGGGYRAVLHVGGVQHSKTSQQLPYLRTWIDRNYGIVHEGKKPLTNTQNIEYCKAVSELPDGVTLLDAVRGFKDGLAQKESLKRGKKFGEGIELFLSECKTRGVRPPTFRNYNYFLNRVAKGWKDIPLSSITVEMVREILAVFSKLAPETRAFYHNLLTIFFNFAVNQNWIVRNPVKPVARPKIPRKRPKIYAVEQVQQIMDAAHHMAPETVPYFALIFFAGVRPETTEKMAWEYIDDKRVFVPMEINKTHHDYEVPMRPNLKAWLDLTPPERRKGNLYSTCNNTRRCGAFKKVRKGLEVKWIKDGARHTFASCVCALEGTEKAVEQMGHQSPTMLYRHYRTLIDKEQAKAFFEIYPKRAPVEFTTSSTSEGSVPILAKTLPEIA